MDRSIQHTAMLANLSALSLTLNTALERAMDAEQAMRDGHANQAIGAAAGVDALLHDAAALLTASFFLHRQGTRL